MFKRDFNSDGLLLCKIQAQIFENSVDKMECDSETFVKKFMNSEIVKMLDSESILNTDYQWRDVLGFFDDEIIGGYKGVKYSKYEMYRIGHLYRYYSFLYMLPSNLIYKIAKPNDLRGLCLSEYTLNSSHILETTFKRLLNAYALKCLLKDPRELRHLNAEEIENLKRGQMIKVIFKDGYYIDGFVERIEEDEEYDYEWTVSIDLLDRDTGFYILASEIDEIIILDE